MKTTNYSIDKEYLLKDISENSEEGIVRLLFTINKKYREKITKELKDYGRVLYNQFHRAKHIGLEIKDPQKTYDLVDRLYDSGIKGILDVGVDSRTLVLADNYSKGMY